LNKLKELGTECFEDGAGSELGGNCGNLYAFLPGKLNKPPLLFSAHMDTVEPAKGKRGILHEDGLITSGGDTILGADDAAGISVILEALTRLDEEGKPRRDIELLFPVAEEIYGLGSRIADYSRIISKEAYVLDLSGAIGEAANAAPTIMSFVQVIRGKSSHAGFAPNEGAHAIRACAKAIAQMPAGQLKPGLTCNIGVVSGGTASNIIPDLCEAKGEIRSLKHEDALALAEKIEALFAEEAIAAGCTAEFFKTCPIKAYETRMESPVALRFERACKAVGAPCHIHSTMGGSDNNNFALHGIEGLVIACSMHEVHSAREYSRLNELELCVRLVMALMSEE
jgi:tripeptide aminopeptidase